MDAPSSGEQPSTTAPANAANAESTVELAAPQEPAAAPQAPAPTPGDSTAADIAAQLKAAADDAVAYIEKLVEEGRSILEQVREHFQAAQTTASAATPAEPAPVAPNVTQEGGSADTSGTAAPAADEPAPEPAPLIAHDLEGGQ